MLYMNSMLRFGVEDVRTKELCAVRWWAKPTTVSAAGFGVPFGFSVHVH